MAWILPPVALAAGVVLPVQFGVNIQLRTFVGGPLAAAAVALGVAALVVQRSLPGSVASAPWWAWTGGLLGALFVLASIILTPRLGAATTIGLILTGQVLASIVIDHFGLIRVPVHEASFPRIIGALLIVAGVVMVQRF
jgi:bacterial/archaeal transporter family-2 protein